MTPRSWRATVVVYQVSPRVRAPDSLASAAVGFFSSRSFATLGGASRAAAAKRASAPMSARLHLLKACIPLGNFFPSLLLQAA